MPSDRFSFPRHAELWPHVLRAMSGRDLAHDADHLLRVAHWAVRLAPEAGANADLAGAAALVHDLDKTGKEKPERPLGGERSARAAGPLLAAAGYDPAEAAEIADAVACSSWSSGLAPGSPLGRVLHDADRLDALGAIGIARVFACHERMAANGAAGTFYDRDDPFGSSRTRDDRRFAVDHFFLKLLTLAEAMHLERARSEARRRHRFLLAFLDELRAELS